jgi:hypothetical protein
MSATRTQSVPQATRISWPMYCVLAFQRGKAYGESFKIIEKDTSGARPDYHVTYTDSEGVTTEDITPELASELIAEFRA